MIIALLLAACGGKDPEPVKETEDPDCFRSIQTNECTDVPHETDGMHSLCENDTEKKNKDCFIMVDDELKHIIDI